MKINTYTIQYVPYTQIPHCVLFSALSSSLVTEIPHSSSYNFFEFSSFMLKKQAQWELRSSLNTSGT